MLTLCLPILPKDSFQTERKPPSFQTERKPPSFQTDRKNERDYQDEQ
jgi:hypothetical protein